VSTSGSSGTGRFYHPGPPPFLGRPGMGMEVGLLEPIAGEVGVDLGGRDVCMPKHLLEGSQIAAPGQEMGGEAVAQRVRADSGVETGGAGVAFDHLVEALATERPAPVVEEEGDAVTAAGQYRPRL